MWERGVNFLILEMIRGRHDGKIEDSRDNDVNYINSTNACNSISDVLHVGNGMHFDWLCGKWYTF